MDPSNQEKPERPKTHYDALQVPTDATPTEVRKAYLRLIKIHHPDKIHPAIDNLHTPTEAIHLASTNQFTQNLIEAYSTLIDPCRREIYDQRMKSQQIPLPHDQSHEGISNPQLARIVSQVVDLSEFTQADHDDEDQEDGKFTLSCRCGGQFMISEEQMESGVDIVGCDGCSLTIKVEYQAL